MSLTVFRTPRHLSIFRRLFLGVQVSVRRQFVSEIINLMCLAKRFQVPRCGGDRGVHCVPGKRRHGSRISCPYWPDSTNQGKLFSATTILVTRRTGFDACQCAQKGFHRELPRNNTLIHFGVRRGCHWVVACKWLSIPWESSDRGIQGQLLGCGRSCFVCL